MSDTYADEHQRQMNEIVLREALRLDDPRHPAALNDRVPIGAWYVHDGRFVTVAVIVHDEYWVRRLTPAEFIAG